MIVRDRNPIRFIATREGGDVVFPPLTAFPREASGSAETLLVGKSGGW